MNWQQATELQCADSDFVFKSSNKLATGILNVYEHCGAVQTFQLTMSILEYKLYLDEHLNQQQATKLPVAYSECVLKLSNKLATGILNGYEHCGAVQTFCINHEHT